MIDNGTAWI